MSKPQWKVDLENKEKTVREREEAEAQAKAAKLASLNGHSAAEVASHAHAPKSDLDVVPELGLVAPEESLDHEQHRLQRHMNASNAKGPSKTPEQIEQERRAAEEKRIEQQRSDDMILKMQRKMAEFEAHKKAHPSQPAVLSVTTEEEEYDEEAKKAQAAMLIGKFIGK